MYSKTREAQQGGGAQPGADGAGSQGGGNGGGAQPGASGPDDVVDADFKEVKDS